MTSLVPPGCGGCADLIAALEWIEALADKTYEQDDKLRSNGARALMRISEKARSAIHRASLNAKGGE